jgi:hypothetical protein
MDELDDKPRCLLVVAPNSRIHEPHLGVSLLKAGLRSHGIPASVYYTNAHLVKVLGLWVHRFVGMDCLLDALFSVIVFPRPVRDLMPLVHDLWRAGILANLGRQGRPQEGFFWLVAALKNFCDGAAERIVGSGAQIVGFSSVFSDRLFCVAVIRAVKRMNPSIRTVVGGPNCDGEMGEELFALFPEIDYVCQGCADKSFLVLARSLIECGELKQPVPGTLSREQPAPYPCPAAALTAGEYEALPDPDFHDYFVQTEEAFRHRGLCRRRHGQTHLAGISQRFHSGMPWYWALNCFPSIPLETCRGCWWASGSVDRRCAFCGDMQAFQCHLQKRPANALAQVHRLAAIYEPATVYLTDRLASPALANGYWDELAAHGNGLRFSTEATGSISRDTVRVMGRAGAGIVQLGIESLDSSDIRAMGKPTDVIHNVATLKYFAEFGMWPFWGYLGPTPAADASNPARTGELIAKVTHLSPPYPAGVKPISIFRFSKYFETPDSYGFGRLEPLPLTRRIYPLSEASLRKLAHDFVPAAPIRAADMTPVRAAIAQWTRVHWRSHLVYVRGRRSGWIIDTRPCRRTALRRLRNNEAAVFDFCCVPRALSTICVNLGLEDALAAGILKAFVRDRTMLCESGLYLALAVEPSGPYRRLRQTTATDLVGRFPLSESAALAIQLGLDRRRAASVMIGGLRAKVTCFFLTFRWRACALALRLAAVLLVPSTVRGAKSGSGRAT